VAERAMYWGGFPWQEAHDSLGLTESGTDWVLGEGRVGGQYGHQTYILLGNTTQTQARVTITYLRENGKPTIVKDYFVNPTSRLSISVNALVPELQNESFGARVTVTNGVGILVERAMYWDAEGMIWAGGTNATGKRLTP
jgi:hypothetical protein